MEYRHCVDGFSLLTAAGLHYYLPGYMAAEVIGSEEADAVIDSLISHFQGQDFYGRPDQVHFWSLLTPAQNEAIGSWLIHYELDYHFNSSAVLEVRNARKWVRSVGCGPTTLEGGG